jgi:small-conductance mechanosensitive channel
MAVAPIGDKLEDVGEKVGEAATGAAQEGWQGLQPLLDQRLLSIGEVTITVGGVIAAVLAILVVLVVSRLARRALDRYGRRHKRVDAASLYAVSRVVHYVLLAIGLVLALDLIGIPMSKFTVFAGGLGIGLGLGLQTLFNNFISGLMLMFDKSLKVGDFVELEAGIRGRVQAINIRATRITTNDNIDILVPNAEFVGGRVVNWTHRSVNRRMRVKFSVAYGVDKELVKKAALEAAERVSFTLKQEGREPQVWLVGFGDSAVEFILAVWLTEAAARRNAAIEAAYLWELDTALKAHGIEIPFPQRDLHVRSLFGLSGDEALAAWRGERKRARKAVVEDETEAQAESLDPRERAALSRNDAGEDAQREIAEEEAERAKRQREGARGDGDDVDSTEDDDDRRDGR